MAWKKVDGFENYSISDDGYVRNDTTTKLLKQHTNNKGYLLVNLWRNNKGYWKTVHRLLAIAFIPNPNNYPQVNHKDGNKQNNRIDNLEWCTQSENQLHRSRVLGKKRVPEEALRNTRMPVICVETGKTYESMSEAARQCGLWEQSISKVLNSTTRTAGGFHWRRYCNGC